MEDKVNERNMKLWHGEHPLGNYQEIKESNIDLLFNDYHEPTDLKEEDRGSDGFIISLNGAKFTYNNDGSSHHVLKHHKIKCDLTWTPVGPIFWKGEKPMGSLHLGKDFDSSGTEEYCNVAGTITYEGKEYEVKTIYGLREHAWMPNIALLDYKTSNWTWWKSSQGYGLFYEAAMNDETKQAQRVIFGCMYLFQDNKSVVAYLRSCNYKNTKLAWHPEHMRMLPIEQEVVATTDDGATINLKLKAVTKPQMRLGVYDPNKMRDDIQGWYFIFWSLPMAVTGTYTYKDGRVVQITDGLGINEPMINTPIT